MVRRISADVARDESKAIGAPGGGPATDTRPDWEKWPRSVETFQGEIPMHDGRIQTRFKLSRACQIKDEAGKVCGEPLIAQRVVNTKFEWDEHHVGGQINYDTKDYRYYIFCQMPRHGPHPPGPPKW